MTKKKKRRGGKSITQTAFKWIRIGALAAPAASRILEQGITADSIIDAFGDYSGYNIREQNFDFGRLLRGWGPYLGAVLATYGIPKLASILRRL